MGGGLVGDHVRFLAPVRLDLIMAVYKRGGVYWYEFQFRPRSTRSWAAHADLDGDGQVSLGDYVTMESYPVLTRGNPASAEVEVREVE